MLRRTLSSLAALTLAGAGLVLLPSTPASSGGAPAITVDTFADDDTKDICTGAPNDCSLRGAFDFANANHVDGVTVDVTVPAGEYLLTDEIYTYEANINVHGAGVGETVVGIDRTTDDSLIRHLELNTDGELIVVLSDMTFEGGNGEQQFSAGGSILARFGAHLTLRRMHFVDNEIRGSGGAVAFYGNPSNATLDIEDSTFAGNGATELGGAIHLSDGETAHLTNSTFTDNVAAFGGALYVGELEGSQEGTATVTHVTMSGNHAEGFQGDPAGGAIGVGSGGDVTVTGSIIENSTEDVGPIGPSAVGDPIDNCVVEDGGALTSGGHNVVDDDTCNATEDTDQPDTAADAQTLGDNGGPTFTMAILVVSPAVDEAGATCDVADDQRGEVRPQDGNADGTTACDAGAYELVAVDEAEEPPAARAAEETPNFTG